MDGAWHAGLELAKGITRVFVNAFLGNNSFPVFLDAFGSGLLVSTLDRALSIVAA
ncbi:MAG: hypothetical protein ACI92G_004585 [Candidatus Pelagisphaera sp.]|jgi:hypothetical protein